MKEASTSKITNPITKLIATRIPKTLWHYTSIDAFKKIVESKQIFATEVRYLNDRSEFTHARQIADKIIAEFPSARSKVDKAVTEAAAELVKYSFEFVTMNKPEVFVASFTAAEDQLSQWRAYSYGTAGVSLGFDLRGFRPKGGTAFAACFAPCICRTDEKKLLLRSAWVGLGQMVERSLRVMKGQQKPLSKSAMKRITPAFDRFLRDILRVSALSKHESFAEEKEWRLVLALVPGKSSAKFTRQFRVKPTTLAPYITYPLSTKTPVLRLTDVILGPGSDENAVYAAKMFLRERLLFMARVRVSKAPYRT